MANIQSGINQFISQAAILGRLAPGFEERQEAHKLGKEEKALRKEHEQSYEGLKNSMVGSGFVGEQELNQMEKTQKRVVDLRERQFKNRPTKENYEQFLKTEKYFEEAIETRKQLQNLKAQTKKTMEMIKAQVKAAEQVGQKMSFDDFKKQLTIKDLPENLKERAYNEYTTSKK